jgi:hypothetical protein
MGAVATVATDHVAAKPDVRRATCNGQRTTLQQTPTNMQPTAGNRHLTTYDTEQTTLEPTTDIAATETQM